MQDYFNWFSVLCCSEVTVGSHNFFGYSLLFYPLFYMKIEMFLIQGGFLYGGTYSIFSFLIQISTPGALEKETAFYHSFENPEGRTIDYFFIFLVFLKHRLPNKTSFSELP